MRAKAQIRTGLAGLELHTIPYLLLLHSVEEMTASSYRRGLHAHHLYYYHDIR